MGMYTGLRGDVEFKQSVAEVIKEYFDSDVIWKEYDLWEWVVKQTYLYLNDFEKDPRSDYIPKGVVCYMPDDWGDGDYFWTGNILNFTCSLKNYSSTIQNFIDILPTIAVSWDLEMLYEEYSTPTVFKN
jgi:hypothetical protein